MFGVIFLTRQSQFLRKIVSRLGCHDAPAVGGQTSNVSFGNRLASRVTTLRHTSACSMVRSSAAAGRADAMPVTTLNYAADFLPRCFMRKIPV